MCPLTLVCGRFVTVSGSVMPVVMSWLVSRWRLRNIRLTVWWKVGRLGGCSAVMLWLLIYIPLWSVWLVLDISCSMASPLVFERLAMNITLLVLILKLILVRFLWLLG